MSMVNPSEYRLEFFKREGFIRKKCKYCGEYFWTLNPEQEHCNDAPCVEYYFWDVEKKARNLSVSEARNLFINFFERKGHRPLSARPVVARWRDDLYLTIASIVVFQPHVTRGIVPPPANPLVIVQPSIRLEDIDNVGLTFGRHLSSFEMGGHHAFNYPDQQVYWKEETVEYAFEFFTRELGIPPEAITFKESWWEGGGNAGPSFEVTVGGLELATLVFMQYDVVDGRYVELPLKVVDTGYGIERIAWFSQHVPTAFHAIYGELVSKFFQELGAEEPEEKLLWEAAKAAGRLDPESIDSYRRFLGEVASRVDRSVEYVRRELEKAASIFGLLDHTKTLALMLGDGIVPSNSGEGYLARLVLRRAVRLIKKLGANVSLKDLVVYQIDYWSKDYYPQLYRNRRYILDVIEYEEKRYLETLSTASQKVEKLLRKKKTLSLDDLIYLYDSHGVPPDLVRDVAKRYGVEISVPSNFYSLVAKKHGASGSLSKPVEKTALPKEITEWAKQFQPTRRLFHENPYMRKFSSRVLGSKDNYLVLEQTAFYPTGGGQLHDTGEIEACGREYRVVDVEKVGDVIVHVLDKKFQNCDNVVGKIDWNRRYRLMRHHTAVHVILGAARRVLGDHVWQAGAEKTPEKARLDITHYKMLTQEEVEEIEKEANNAILDMKPVTVTIMDRNRAEEQFGFRIYQGGVPMTPELRIVSIRDWDVEACFGTHVENTKEIGGVKIISARKLQDGIIRLELVAGTELAEYAKKLERTINEASKIVNASRENLVERVDKLVKEYRALKKRLNVLERKTIQMIINNAEKYSIDFKDFKVYVFVNVGLSEEGRRELLKTMIKKDPKSIVMYAEETDGKTLVEISTAMQREIDLRKVARSARSIGYRGGGKPDHITVVGSVNAEKIVDDLLRIIKETINGSISNDER